MPLTTPSRVTIELIAAERVDIYCHIPSSSKTTPLGVNPFPVDDSIPENEDISWAVCRIHLNLSGVQLGMRAE